MRYIKIFEDFKDSEINKFKKDFNDLLVELTDKGFEVNYDFRKPYNSRDEVSLNIYRTNGGNSCLLYDYEDVSEYLMLIKDYMDNYYNTELEVQYQKCSYLSGVLFCPFDKFISTEENNKKIIGNNKKFYDSDLYKFLTIKLKFIIINKL